MLNSYHLYKLLLPALFVLGLCAAERQAVPCTRPSVRREWRKLSLPERAEWIAAINCLAKLPHTNALTPSVDPSISNIPPVNSSGSYWDDIVYIHMDLNTKIHNTGLFFPFHRFYVNAVESAMKDFCGYTGAFPYWDWSIDAHDVQNSPLFREASPISGLGGWGDPSKDFQVQDGGFRHLEVAYPIPHIIRRNFTLQPFLPFASVPMFTNLTQYANESFMSEISNLHRFGSGCIPMRRWASVIEDASVGGRKRSGWHRDAQGMMVTGNLMVTGRRPRQRDPGTSDGLSVQAKRWPSSIAMHIVHPTSSGSARLPSGWYRVLQLRIGFQFTAHSGML